MDPRAQEKWRKYFPALIVLPIAMGVLALRTNQVFFKLGEPAACGILILAFRQWFGLRHAGFILAALGWSMAGDYFLSHRAGHSDYFVLGIAAFFAAHLGYLGFALKNGLLSGLALLVLLAVYLPFYGFYLRPAIADHTLRVAALLYLLISCVSLAAAIGLRLSWRSKAFYILGIGLVLLSDTIIAFSEFLRVHQWNAGILPTYYLAHVSITLALFCREDKRRVG